MVTEDMCVDSIVSWKMYELLPRYVKPTWLEIFGRDFMSNRYITSTGHCFRQLI